jgi:D-glycero-D-manno-heptose 1,7-bisphosphate phosphatase
MAEELKRDGAKVDAVYYCPHVSADRCACRKPKTGMREAAARDLGLALGRSFVVGDRHGDVELAERAGAQSILVRTGYGEGELAWHAKHWTRPPDFVAADLAEAADWILKEVSR